MKEFTRIRYEAPAPHVARIVLDRVDTRNAQDAQLLYELNDAFDIAAQDDAVKVIILAANGPHFSSGHDLRDAGQVDTVERFKTVGTWSGFRAEGAEGRVAFEKEAFFGFSERWRNIPKPTIAQVQGKAIAGALLLIWPCDLIVASDDAQFQDNTVAMGVNGVEFFAHPYEFGARKAKEMLFRASWVSAAEAHRLGMVNHVVPRDDLASFTLDLAVDIARKPMFALRLAKESVNAAQDAQGRLSAMATAFAQHQLGHAHNRLRFQTIIDPSFFDQAPQAMPGLKQAIVSFGGGEGRNNPSSAD
ncbi:enoyl-CoA hydratase [Bradyrhizobium sp. 2TAF24]|uniref:enoyl-CoA hydratase n=1 Tax=Bradyrhizobium sp. 2TAF24 TaxID=3233011 RepID=UPI003F90417C